MKGHMTQTKTEERNIKVTNPYSGQSEMLTQSEAIHYHMIKKFEELDTMSEMGFSLLANYGRAHP